MRKEKLRDISISSVLKCNQSKYHVEKDEKRNIIHTHNKNSNRNHIIDCVLISSIHVLECISFCFCLCVCFGQNERVLGTTLVCCILRCHSCACLLINWLVQWTENSVWTAVTYSHVYLTLSLSHCVVYVKPSLRNAFAYSHIFAFTRLSAARESINFFFKQKFTCIKCTGNSCAIICVACTFRTLQYGKHFGSCCERGVQNVNYHPIVFNSINYYL